MADAIDRSKVHAEIYPGAANEVGGLGGSDWECEEHPGEPEGHLVDGEVCGGPFVLNPRALARWKEQQ